MGNTMHYTKATGQSFGELRYDVWGAPTLSGKLLNNDNGNFVAANFTGHTYDTVLDIYFAEARFYDAANRQWMSRDPVKDGLNWYSYVGANPTTYFDPNGLYGARADGEDDDDDDDDSTIPSSAASSGNKKQTSSNYDITQKLKDIGSAIKDVGTSVLQVGAGTIDSIGTAFSGGAYSNPYAPDTTAYKIGNVLGDAASVLGSGVATFFGGGAAIAGKGMTIGTGGALAIPGEMVSAIGGAIATYGIMVSGVAATNFGQNANDLFQKIECEGDSNSDELKDVYNSIKDSPNYPDGFEPRQNGITKNNVKNGGLLDKLRKIESGTWKKIYKDGYDSYGYDSYGNEVSIHYFQSESGKVFDVKVKPGWSN